MNVFEEFNKGNSGIAKYACDVIYAAVSVGGTGIYVCQDAAQPQIDVLLASLDQSIDHPSVLPKGR